jgi:ribulose-phosphate 3-epimerase
MQFVPSILETDINQFSYQLQRLSLYFNWFQIDIADGLFVPNKTIQIENIILAIQQFNNLTISNFVFDFHLMVKDYETEIKKLSQLNNKVKIKNIFIHASTNPNYQLLTTNYSSFTFGLVLDPADDIKTINQKYDLKNNPIIQIMTVNPGFQGSSFIPDMLNKVDQLSELNYKTNVFIDGAVNDKTIPLILSRKNLPDVLCIGSYLTKANNLKERVNYLKSVLITE